MKNRLIAPSLTLVAGLTLAVPLAGHALSGLAGQELKPVSETKKRVLTGLGEFLGRSIFSSEDQPAAADSGETLDELARFIGGRLEDESESAGRIAGVLVLDDTENRLLVRVAHHDLAGCTLTAHTLNSDRRPQNAVRGGTAAVLTGDVQTELELALDPETSTDHLDSSFLLIAAKDCPAGANFGRRFELTKSWTRPMAAADRLIEVTPRPVGAAATLGASSSTLSLPPVVSTKRYARAVYRAPTAATSATRSGSRQPIAQVHDHRSGAGNGSRESTTRDHRTSTGSGSRESTTRDHRTSTGSGSRQSTTRDHRTSAGSGSRQSTTRDHRTSTGSGGRPSTTRDHRTSAGSGSRQPTTRVRDHRIAAGSFGQLVYGVQPKDEERGALGPANVPIDLLEGLRVEPTVDLDYAQILDTFPVVFRDQTEASGVFYFLPGRYSLAWAPHEGYGVDFLYNAVVDDSLAGAVTVNLQLDSGVDAAEVQFARRLLEAQHSRGAIARKPILRRLPISAAPEVRLAASLAQQYDIAPENVVPNSASDTLGELSLAISTDRVTKENLQLALTDGLGLSGTATFSTGSTELPALDVEIEARLSDSRTFGRLAWQRDREWRSEIPYPVRLRYLHALLLEKNEPVVYSWDLGGTEVPSQARLALDTSALPSWLEGRALRTWIDYVVDRDCEPCKQAAVESITGGVTTLASGEINFKALRPLADSGALEIALSVRSRYFHPQHRDLVSKPVMVMSEDGRSYPVGPIYASSHEAEASGEPLFEYQLHVVMPDGTTHPSTRWIDGHRLYVPIGSVQIEQALGFIPGPAGSN